MQQQEQYTINVPKEFAFDWLLHGNYFLSRLNLQSFQFDHLETGGRFIAYEEKSKHRFVPMKGEYLKLERPARFQIRMWFPGGIQTVAYQLEEIGEGTTKVQVTLHEKYYSFLLGVWMKIVKKKRSRYIQLIFALEKEELEEAFAENRLNTKISGVQIAKDEMKQKWEHHYPHNPYYSWVRPEV